LISSICFLILFLNSQYAEKKQTSKQNKIKYRELCLGSLSVSYALKNKVKQNATLSQQSNIGQHYHNFLNLPAGILGKIVDSSLI
jgi:hypothetical protein